MKKWIALTLVIALLCGMGSVSSLAEENIISLLDLVNMMTDPDGVAVPTEPRTLEAEYSVKAREGVEDSGDKLLAAAVSVIRQRLELYGIKDAEVQADGTDRITLVIPDTQGVPVDELIEAEGSLEFVDEDGHVFLTNEMIGEANAYDFGEQTVTCVLTEAGKEALKEIVSAGAGKTFNILLNGEKLISDVPFEQAGFLLTEGSFDLNGLGSAKRTKLAWAWLNTSPMLAELTAVSSVETTPNRAALESLAAFLDAWKNEDYQTMLKVSSYDWKERVGRSEKLMELLFSQRKLMDYSFVSIAGTGNDESRTITVNATIRKDGSDTLKGYRYDVPVTMYPDGEWYVEPDDIIGYVKTGYEGSTAGNCAKAFFNAWKSMDIDTMLELCSTAWKEEQVNPRVSLLMRMGSGTLLKYAIDEIQAGDSPGNWACPMLTVLMDFGEAGGQEELNASVTVNKEADGRWYLDPDTLRWQ